jgi:hypothetical protein
MWRIAAPEYRCHAAFQRDQDGHQLVLVLVRRATLKRIPIAGKTCRWALRE